MLVELLRQHQQAGSIEVDDLEMTAGHFLAMIELLPARLADFGINRSPAAQERHLAKSSRRP